MATTYPEVAVITSPSKGAVFSPTTPPLLKGSCKDADKAYARLWKNGKMLWMREMSSLGGGNFQYQTVVGTVNEIKRYTFGAGVTGGSFSLTYHDVTTAPLPFVNNKAQMEERAMTALNNHPDFADSTGLSVDYNTTTRALTVTYQGPFGKINLNDMNLINKLTGPSPTVVAAAVQDGNGDIPDINSGAGEYEWDMIGYKNSTALYSKGFKVARSATSSGRAKFYLDTTPTVTMDTGTNKPQINVTTTVATSTVPFSWQVSSLLPVAWQEINLVNDATNEQVDVTPGAPLAWTSTDPDVRSYTLPYASISGDGTIYRWSLRVRSISGLTRFLTGKIKLVYTPPAMIGSATLLFPTNESMLLTWGKSTDVDFVDYVIRVRPLGTPFVHRKNIPIERISDKNITTASSYQFPFNTNFIVSLTQRVLRAGEIIESNPVEWATFVPYSGIHMSQLGGAFPDRRVVSVPAHTGRSVEGKKENILITPWGASDPIPIYQDGSAYDINFTIKVMGSQAAFPAPQKTVWNDIKDLYENYDHKPILVRDAMGDMYTCVMQRPVLNMEPGGPAPTVDVSLTTIQWNSVLL